MSIHWILLLCKAIYMYNHIPEKRERSSSVVECLTGDGGVVGWSFTVVTALCP